MCVSTQWTFSVTKNKVTQFSQEKGCNWNSYKAAKPASERPTSNDSSPLWVLISQST